MIRSLYAHRTLIASLVRQEFQLTSVRASLGLGWLVIEPAIQIAIYTLVFGTVLGARLPTDESPLAYGLYVCAGLLTWTFFTQIVTRGLDLFLSHAAILKSLRFPRSALPIALVLVTGTQFAIAAILFVFVLAALGRLDGVALLSVLPVLGIQVMLAVGLAIIVGTLHVFFRDVSHATSIFLQFWFWLTPIVYPLSIVPESARVWIERNPLTPIVRAYQDAVLAGRTPTLEPLLVPAGLAITTLSLAWLLFRGVDAELVDEL